MKKKPLEIVVIQGGGRGARHSLVAPHIVLGRLDPLETAGPGSMLFPEPTVSRIHATLDWDEAANRYLLTHRSATNPTILNKSRVTKPRHVSPGDKIQMGNLVVEVRVGIGQHAEVELETVDFTALTKRAADQVYRPESLMPEAPAVPSAGPQSPQEAPGPIPAPIPPPARRQLPQPVFNEPYAPQEYVPSPLPAASRAEPPAPSRQFFEFPDAEEQVAPLEQVPRRVIQLSSLPRQDKPEAEEVPVVDARLLDLKLEDTGVLIQPAPPSQLEIPSPAEPEPVPEAEAEPIPAEGRAEPQPPPEKVKQKPIRREKPKIGRNQPCPCGSGKKYKKCCGQ
ncbi:SEC-C domain-containing protein [bacterium]|nr:SEC-C domain-containing protein [bacterium]